MLTLEEPAVTFVVGAILCVVFLAMAFLARRGRWVLLTLAVMAALIATIGLAFEIARRLN